ncbi:EcoAI/FtnUII family type I restriction enzme subunit R [Mesorhizobium sp. RSR565B]|uniref:EcoAI/FtnUII family type I restriction enzme subunit R n=1 Tax=unclassified Mesorhizobium TaxID=325217 RepID=UPI0003CF9C26|nr:MULTISPECIES: DEAD/DEAH box helicase family protein [unclassified Mesorhizobium]ESY07315.1 DEAD/DEAH box helicase [Mesorhizobium sp. LNJC399B00]ESZ43590.1 DEAD/DEAH box helicase [Mesorhizobium sp. L103C565B0]
MTNEADTCRKYVVPRLQAAGWDNDPHSIAEQRSITDGRVIPVGKGFVRKPPKRVDYLLRHNRDFPLAVVEAKAGYKTAADAVQQARSYAEMLGLKFAYATNGSDVIEIDYFTGQENRVSTFATPDELWVRYQAGSGITNQAQAAQLLAPYNHVGGKTPRYYQQIAINRTIEAILGERKRILLTMATGTGKTMVAFQICWKLWSTRWNCSGAHRKPRILFLADRNILIDDPKDKTFAPFGDARHKIESGEVVYSREMYFAIYQALAEDERREGLFRDYPPDFFDLIIVDECHRGSARSDSSWRGILEHFKPAYQLGMTATPLRDDNRDTYLYFGNPIYEYSLRQGIDDGFLAPYRVHRVVTAWDAAGWRPSKDELDRYGRAIPDDEYQTRDFERVVALRARTLAIARHLTDFLKKTDRFAKTIVFCVDQEHASEMREALVNLNSDLVAQYPDYVARVTADEGAIGRGHLSRFQDVDKKTPAILTSSQLLTTGVDAPTCKNVVLSRIVGSMSEFKQIIGRGTRLRDDYGKLWFNIVDYTGTATRMFADPTFDGDPTRITEEEIGENGETTSTTEVETGGEDAGGGEAGPVIIEPPTGEPRKFYFDGGQVEVVAHLVHELDPNGKQLRVLKYTEYAAESVRSIAPSSVDLRERWADAEKRAEIIEALAERGIDFGELIEQVGQPEADPFDLLCHLAFNAPLRTRRERAQRLKSERKDFFDRYSPEAKEILDELLEKYAEHGDAQFLLPDVLRVPPISTHGQPAEIIRLFGGPEELRQAVNDLQGFLYGSA